MDKKESKEFKKEFKKVITKVKPKSTKIVSGRVLKAGTIIKGKE